jgi:hypothetical protein
MPDARIMNVIKSDSMCGNLSSPAMKIGPRRLAGKIGDEELHEVHLRAPTMLNFTFRHRESSAVRFHQRGPDNHQMGG